MGNRYREQYPGPGRVEASQDVLDRLLLSITERISELSLLPRGNSELSPAKMGTSLLSTWAMPWASTMVAPVMPNSRKPSRIMSRWR